MPPTKSSKDSFDKTATSFAKAMKGWGALASQQVAAQGLGEVVPVVERLRDFLARIVRFMFERLKQILQQLDPLGAAQDLWSVVMGGIDEMLASVNELIDDLLAAPGVAADQAIAAVLGLIEAIKKAFHLILDGIKLPAITQPVEVFLDLIDNILGNIAELMSPKAGHTAKMFRENMYGQLYAIRRADAARAGRGATVRETKDEE